MGNEWRYGRVPQTSVGRACGTRPRTDDVSVRPSTTNSRHPCDSGRYERRAGRPSRLWLGARNRRASTACSAAGGLERSSQGLCCGGDHRLDLRSYRFSQDLSGAIPDRRGGPGLAAVSVDPWFGEPYPEAPPPRQERSRTGRCAEPKTRSLATSPEGFVIVCPTWQSARPPSTPQRDWHLIVLALPMTAP